MMCCMKHKLEFLPGYVSILHIYLKKDLYKVLLNYCFEFRQPNLFLIDESGGIGKKFLYNILLARLRCEGRIAIVVTSLHTTTTLLDVG